MSIGTYSGPSMLPIAARSELRAAIWEKNGGKFVTIAGPCGAHHVMSMDEAALLQRWLALNLPNQADAAYDLTRLAIQKTLYGQKSVWKTKKKAPVKRRAARKKPA